MRAEAPALPKLRSNHAARSNNVAIWRSTRSLFFRMPSLWRVAHRGSVNATIRSQDEQRAEVIPRPCISSGRFWINPYKSVGSNPARTNLSARTCPPHVASPPPWSVEELEACFIVRDHNGQVLTRRISLIASSPKLRAGQKRQGQSTIHSSTRCMAQYWPSID